MSHNSNLKIDKYELFQNKLKKTFKDFKIYQNISIKQSLTDFLDSYKQKIQEKEKQNNVINLLGNDNVVIQNANTRDINIDKSKKDK